MSLDAFLVPKSQLLDDNEPIIVDDLDGPLNNYLVPKHKKIDSVSGYYCESSLSKGSKDTYFENITHKIFFETMNFGQGRQYSSQIAMQLFNKISCDPNLVFVPLANWNNNYFPYYSKNSFSFEAPDSVASYNDHKANLLLESLNPKNFFFSSNISNSMMIAASTIGEIHFFDTKKYIQKFGFSSSRKFDKNSKPFYSYTEDLDFHTNWTTIPDLCPNHTQSQTHQTSSADFAFKNPDVFYVSFLDNNNVVLCNNQRRTSPNFESPRIMQTCCSKKIKNGIKDVKCHGNHVLICAGNDGICDLLDTREQSKILAPNAAGSPSVQAIAEDNEHKKQILIQKQKKDRNQILSLFSSNKQQPKATKSVQNVKPSIAGPKKTNKPPISFMAPQTVTSASDTFFSMPSGNEFTALEVSEQGNVVYGASSSGKLCIFDIRNRTSSGNKKDLAIVSKKNDKNPTALMDSWDIWEEIKVFVGKMTKTYETHMKTVNLQEKAYKNSLMLSEVHFSDTELFFSKQADLKIQNNGGFYFIFLSFSPKNSQNFSHKHPDSVTKKKRNNKDTKKAYSSNNDEKIDPETLLRRFQYSKYQSTTNTLFDGREKKIISLQKHPFHEHIVSFALENGYFGLFDCYRGKVLKLFCSSMSSGFEEYVYQSENHAGIDQFFDFGIQHKRKWEILGKQRPLFFRNSQNFSMFAAPQFNTKAVFLLDWTNTEKSLYLEHYQPKSTDLTVCRIGTSDAGPCCRLETSCFPPTTISFDETTNSLFCGTVGDVVFVAN